MTTPEHDAEQQELDQLQAGIDDARRVAQEHGTIPSEEPRQTLIDPDADGDADEAPGLIGGL